MEGFTNKNYVAYHVHSDFSLLDSCTDYKLYVDRAKELNQKAICFSEHGNIFNWVLKKMYCDSSGIKYIHGVEAYLTESLENKVRDNYHTILIAKNFDGVKEVNSIISKSYQKDHFYYKNRITFNEFFELSDNVIKISACLASPLNKLNVNHPLYESLVKSYNYLEIQPHDYNEQKLYNIHLAELSQKYKIPLIAGTDTHSLNKYKAECRSILQAAKHIVYTDEDSFDLTYKSYEELVEMFKKQDSLPEQIYMDAINNTNIMSDSVEDFKIDGSPKYPKLYGDKDSEVYDKKVWDMFYDKVKNGVIPECQVDKFKHAIKEESDVFEHVGMKGFILSMSEFVSHCKNNGVPVGPARGSVGGSRVAYVMDIIDLNPETWNTVFSRFCNKDRKEIGDIDIDLAPEDRQFLYDYIINRFGKDYTGYVLAIGTVSERGTIDEICRGLSIKFENENGKEVENPFSLKNADKIKTEYTSNSEKARSKYPEVFYYFDGILNTKISQSMHPAGIIASPISLPDNYGTLINDDKIILQIDMDCLHETGAAKYDILGLENIGIIKDTCRLANIPYPKSHEIDWNDQAVWEDMIKSPVGIFQMESPASFRMLKKFKAKSIFDMALVTACIRPSGASYRDDLMEKKFHYNVSPVIDELLKDNYGYLVYQCDVLKFLQQICGLSGSEADNVRRAIGRKDKERLEKALPEIQEGYIKKSGKPRDEAIQELEEYIKVLIDSSSYMFGYNHAIGYCMIGYLCAYLRYYYPYEFITSYLNHAKTDEDILKGTELAKEYGIRVTLPRFRMSSDVYSFDKNSKTISKGMSSIKFLNKSVCKQLFEIGKLRYKSFSDLLFKITSETSLDARQLDILVKLDYFEEFGNSKTLLRIIDMFNEFKQGNIKQIKKEKVDSCWMKEVVPLFATDKKKDGSVSKNYVIIDAYKMIEFSENKILEINITPFTYKDKMMFQEEYLGYIDLTTNKKEDRTKLFIKSIFPMKSKSGDIWAYTLITQSIGTGKQGRITVMKNIYQKMPVKEKDIINALTVFKNNRGYWQMSEYDLVI